MVCFIHRPEYYKIYTSADGSDLRGRAEIIIAKHRNGAVGDVRLRFIGQYTRFQNPEDDMVIPPPTAVYYTHLVTLTKPNTSSQ